MVLLVDDDAAIRGMITAVLRRDGVTCDIAENGDEAISMLRRGSYKTVLLDLMLPGSNGFEVLRFLKAEKPSMLRRVIVLTAASEVTLRYFDDREAVFELLRKPFDIDSLRGTVSACREQQLEQ